jgi:hypothetical protein
MVLNATLSNISVIIVAVSFFSRGKQSTPGKTPCDFHPRIKVIVTIGKIRLIQSKE